ncbi:MAG: hypothetical protein NC037_00155 [Bacteroides sp.]|nr:hypothetical protein [Bacteroides sp.]
MEIVIKDNDKAQEKVFYQYKIRVELPNQMSIFDMDEQLNERERKNLAVEKIFNWIKDRDSYYDFEKLNTQLSIIKLQVLSESILIFKLAKRKDVQLTSREETFVGKTEQDYPYSLVIFDYIGQVFYVEKNYKVFQFPNNMVGILQALLSGINAQISQDNQHKFFINMITDSAEFIECFDTFDLVSKVSLKFDSPNCFLGSVQADELLKEIKNETNAKKTTMEISSDDGLLGCGIMRIFKDLVTYIFNGGGSWSMSGKPKGKDKTITKNSKTKIKTLNININISSDQNTINNSDEVINVIESQNRFDNE